MSYDFYVDESSQNAHQYLALGGLVVATPGKRVLVQRIREARHPSLPAGELKWEKVSRSKLAAYKKVIDQFFIEAQADQIHFHCLFADTHRFDHKFYNEGDSEIGFNKLIYQLLIKFGRIYQAPLYVYLDQRTTHYSLDDLRLILNRGIAKRWNIEDNPFRRITFRDSKKTQLLQLNDVLLGAVTAQRNGHHLCEGASLPKAELGAYILRKARIRDLSRNTPRNQRHFTIWNFLLGR